MARKKPLQIVAASLMSALLLTACGESVESNPVERPEPDAQDETPQLDGNGGQGSAQVDRSDEQRLASEPAEDDLANKVVVEPDLPENTDYLVIGRDVWTLSEVKCTTTSDTSTSYLNEGEYVGGYAYLIAEDGTRAGDLLLQSGVLADPETRQSPRRRTIEARFSDPDSEAGVYVDQNAIFSGFDPNPDLLVIPVGQHRLALTGEGMYGYVLKFAQVGEAFRDHVGDSRWEEVSSSIDGADLWALPAKDLVRSHFQPVHEALGWAPEEVDEWNRLAQEIYEPETWQLDMSCPR